MAWLRLFAYIAVTVLAGVAIQYRTSHNLHKIERLQAKQTATLTSLRTLHGQFCHSFIIVRNNQMLVLMTLQEWNSAFADRTKAGLRPVPSNMVAKIAARLKTLRKQAVCRP